MHFRNDEEKLNNRLEFIFVMQDYTGYLPFNYLWFSFIFVRKVFENGTILLEFVCWFNNNP